MAFSYLQTRRHLARGIGTGGAGVDEARLLAIEADIAELQAVGGGSSIEVTLTGDGSTTTFNTGVETSDDLAVLAFIDGVAQPATSYSMAAGVLTFDTAPPASSLVQIRVGLGAYAAGGSLDAAALDARLDNAETEIDALQVTIAGQADTISDAEADIDALQASVALLQPELSAATADILALGGVDNAHAAQIATNAAAIATLQGTVATLDPPAPATKVANYTLASTDKRLLIPVNTAGSVTITVPAAGTLGDGFFCQVLALGAGTVVLDGPGAANLTLTTGQLGTVFAAGGQVYADATTPTKLS